jgi:hypothetical protein
MSIQPRLAVRLIRGGSRSPYLLRFHTHSYSSSSKPRPPLRNSIMASNTKTGSDHGTPHEVKEARIRPRWVPTVSYTVQNIFLSMGTATGAFSSLIFTIAIVLPLACVRAALSRTTTALIPPPASLRRGKVVLVVGASSGIGLEVLKQYCPEPDTTVIAVSDKAGEYWTRLSASGG